MTPRAIVTGGAGFIGSHVVDALLENGYEVTVIDDLSTGDARRVAESAQLRELDIVDAAALEAVVTEVQPRAIFHLAAQASVVASVEKVSEDPVCPTFMVKLEPFTAVTVPCTSSISPSSSCWFAAAPGALDVILNEVAVKAMPLTTPARPKCAASRPKWKP